MRNDDEHFWIARNWSTDVSWCIGLSKCPRWSSLKTKNGDKSFWLTTSQAGSVTVNIVDFK